MDWNLTDLTKILALSGAVFAVLRVVVGKPLITQVVNPHRPTWLFAAFGFLTGAFGLLRTESHSSSAMAILAPLKALVTEERASGPVMIAAVALFNALVILGVLAYCVWRLPRDPSTFRRAKDQAKVVRYYTNLPGGLDFSTLIRLSKKDGAQAVYLATGVNVNEIQKRLDELVPFRTAESQIAWWTSLALDMHTEMDRMNAILGKGGQGINRRVLFDVQFGGYLFQYLRPPEVGEDYLFAFGATLVQAEVNTRRFEEHFELMIAALRNIKAGMEKV